MPTWKCPKCGSTDSYDATELQQKVSGSGGGASVGIIGNELGDTGITPMFGGSQKINVSSETVEVSVKKCRQCDTLLGEKDKIYSPEEQAVINERRARLGAKRRDDFIKSRNTTNAILYLIAVIFILGVTFIIDVAFIHDGLYNLKEGEWLWLTWFTLHTIIFTFFYKILAHEKPYFYLIYPISIIIIGVFFAPILDYNDVKSILVYVITIISLSILSLPTIKFIQWAIAPPKKKIQSQPKKENKSTTRIKCPNCASRDFTQHFEIPNELLGSKIECPKCLTKFIASKN